jgi:hypothetical protein
MSQSINLPSLFSSVPPCASYNDANHTVFLTTNEEGQEKTLNTLARHPVNGNTMIGVSGFFTLNAASVRGTRSGTAQEIDYVIILDRSDKVALFWQDMSSLIQNKGSREQTLLAIQELILREHSRYFLDSKGNPFSNAVSRCSMLNQEIGNSISWLSSDAQYARIKRIFDTHHFAFIKIDLCDLTAMRVFSEILKQNNLTVDTAYLSNVYEYTIVYKNTQLNRRYYIESLRPLIAPNTLVVHAPSRVCVKCDSLYQVIQRLNHSPVEDLFQEPSKPSCYFILPKGILSHDSN